MQLSLDLAQQILSMVLMGFVGFLLSRFHVVTAEESRIVSRTCVYAIIPASMINAFQNDLDANRLSGLALAFLAAVLIHGMYFLVTGLMNRTRFSLTNEEVASTVYNNAGNLVIPMLYGVAALGGEYVFYTSAYIAIQNLLMWSHGQQIMGSEGKPSLKKIFGNPCMISIMVGIVFFFLQIKVSGPVGTAISSLAACLGPISMLVIGMMLGEQNLKEVFSDGNVYRVSAIRLLLLPVISMVILVVLAKVWNHPDVNNILTVSLLCAVGPAAATTTQQAQLYNNPHRAYVSAINVVSTILCAITMPMMVLIFQMLVA